MDNLGFTGSFSSKIPEKLYPFSHSISKVVRIQTRLSISNPLWFPSFSFLSASFPRCEASVAISSRQNLSLSLEYHKTSHLPPLKLLVRFRPLAPLFLSNMPTSPKPTILLVPGAWHSPSHYATLLSRLQTAGYHTVCSRLPSVASVDPLTATAAQDTSFIREKMLLPLLEQEKDILLVLHSYGGLPGSAAAKDFSKSERTKQGKKGGIIGLVLMAALLAREGDSLEQMMGGKLHGWVAVDVCHTPPFKYLPLFPTLPLAPYTTKKTTYVCHEIC